jgi:hypothetical protein
VHVDNASTDDLWIAVGGKAAIEEIHHEGLALQLCQRCQETVERARRVHTSSTATKIPKSSERVNRVRALFVSKSCFDPLTGADVHGQLS